MNVEMISGACLGIGLSAACGFRVFLPLLLVSVAGLTGHLDLGSGFGWMATWPAMVLFGTATLAETLGYFIPWFDHALDVVAAPLAVVAGIALSASQFVDFDPMWRWTLAIIAGGGAAGAVKGLTALLRAASTATTGGVANPVVSALEFLASLVTTVMALLVPLLVVALLIAGIGVAWWLLRRRRKPTPVSTTAPA